MCSTFIIIIASYYHQVCDITVAFVFFKASWELEHLFTSPAATQQNNINLNTPDICILSFHQEREWWFYCKRRTKASLVPSAVNWIGVAELQDPVSLHLCFEGKTWEHCTGKMRGCWAQDVTGLSITKTHTQWNQQVTKHFTSQWELIAFKQFAFGKHCLNFLPACFTPSVLSLSLYIFSITACQEVSENRSLKQHSAALY